MDYLFLFLPKHISPEQFMFGWIVLFACLMALILFEVKAVLAKNSYSLDTANAAVFILAVAAVLYTTAVMLMPVLVLVLSTFKLLLFTMYKTLKR